MEGWAEYSWQGLARLQWPCQALIIHMWKSTKKLVLARPLGPWQALASVLCPPLQLVPCFCLALIHSRLNVEVRMRYWVESIQYRAHKSLSLMGFSPFQSWSPLDPSPRRGLGTAGAARYKTIQCCQVRPGMGAARYSQVQPDTTRYRQVAAGCSQAQPLRVPRRVNKLWPPWAAIESPEVG